MEVNLTDEVQYVYSISVLPEGGVVEIHKHQLCIETSGAYSLCVVDIGGAKDNTKTTESNEDFVGNLRSEGLVTHLQKVFWQRQQESLKMGGKVLQLFLALVLTLLKFASIDNRRRTYKRASFFDSRTVVLTLSILIRIPNDT